MKKPFLLTLLLNTAFAAMLHAQQHQLNSRQKKNIETLISQYSQARENRDTTLLRSILTSESDQLVSTGEWRDGINASLKGMLNSSSTNPGTRTLTVERVRLVGKGSAITDCKYEIQNSDGTVRRMWSTFIVVSVKGEWRITAIRNMLPAAP